MNLTPEMILRGYQANTAALEEMIFVKGKVAVVTALKKRRRPKCGSLRRI